jgi:hypothetical protein
VELPAQQRLGDEMEPFDPGVHLVGFQRARPRARRPVAPVPAQPGLRAAEAGVVEQLFVHQRRRRRRVPGQRGPDFGVRGGHVQPFGRGRRAMGVAQVEDQLRPEEPAHR